MRQVTIHAAKTNLSRLIEAALGSAEVIIAKGSKPMVRIVPIAQAAFKVGLLQGKLGAGPDFLEPMAARDLDLWEGRG